VDGTAAPPTPRRGCAARFPEGLRRPLRQQRCRLGNFLEEASGAYGSPRLVYGDAAGAALSGTYLFDPLRLRQPVERNGFLQPTEDTMSSWTRTSTAVLSTVVLLGACGSDTPRAEAPALPPAEAEAPPAMAVQEDELGRNLSAHMQQMAAADGAEMQAMVPRQRELVMAMIEECKMMMQQMGMREPPVWMRLENALREDVNRMPRMGPMEIAEFFPQHRERAQQMMDMRGEMMSGM